jgi:hypothetical protein
MASNEKAIYNEWQYPRVSSFAPLILLIPAIWIVAAPFNTDIGLAIGAFLAGVAALLKLRTAKRIVVTEKLLLLGSAQIPRTALGRVEIVPSDHHFAERGSKLDARAFVFLKYGLPEMVKISVTDPKDPTPYILISTRNAKQLRACLMGTS